jgi:hypothetical protein
MHKSLGSITSKYPCPPKKKKQAKIPPKFEELEGIKNTETKLGARTCKA